MDNLWWNDPTWNREAAEQDLENIVRVLAHLGDDVGLAAAWELIGALRLDSGHAGDAALPLERALEHERRSGQHRSYPGPL